MALSSTTEWEVRTDGNDLNGGGFNPSRSGATKTSTDNYTYGPSYATYSGTNLTVDLVTNTYVQPDGYTPVTADIGHVIQISGGTGWTTGFYEITGIVGSQWILDRSPAAAGTAGGVWRLGGALATPGKAGGAHVGGNLIWIKSGTYTISSGTANVSNGTVNLANPGAAVLTGTRLFGYGTTRGDGGMATLNVAVAFGTGTAVVGATVRRRCTAANLWVNNAASQAVGMYTAFQNLAVAYRCVSTGVNGETNKGFASCTSCYACVSADADYGYYEASTLGCYIGCVAYNCTTGFRSTGFGYKLWCFQCVAFRCNTGFMVFGDNNSANTFVSCHAVRCTSGYQYGAKDTVNDWANMASITGCTAVNCTYAIANEGTLGGSVVVRKLWTHGCTNTWYNATSNLPLIYDIEALASDPFPGAGANDTWQTANFTPAYPLVMNDANWYMPINDSWRIGVLPLATSGASRPINLGGGFNL